MTTLEETLTRFVARRERRALLTRTTSQLASDPGVTIGIATIKIVTEEQVQAIAYGRFDGPPFIDVRLDPLSRDVQDLMAFARFVIRAADEAVNRQEPLRVWVPHEKTLESLDVLGHRYWRNTQAPPEIRRMGEICRVIAREASFPGQQLVAVATDVLRAHLTTGQAPVEDGHLGALLAWLDPDCDDPLTEGRRRVRVPASGVLQNTPDRPDDDRVDRLRKLVKETSGRARSANEHRLAGILRAAADREWQLLADARCAFMGLGLSATGLGDLVKASNKRVMDALTRGFFPARRAHALAAQLEEMEAGQGLAEKAALEQDPRVREAARRAGTAVQGVISLVNQPQRGRQPCTIFVDSPQGTIRSRRDDKVRLAGTNVTGVIRSITANAGGTRVEIEVLVGVRSSNVLIRGNAVEVLGEGYANPRGHIFYEVSQRQPWMFYADAAPALAPATAPTATPLQIAASRRRP